jgi:MFS family permease
MYVLLIIATFFCMVGMFVPLFLIPSYAITQGMDTDLANNLVAILNSASFFGRVIPGILGDKLGRINTLIAAGTTTGIITFCWPKAESNAAIIVIAILIGFSSGAIASCAGVAFSLCPEDPRNIGTYMGVGMAVAAGSALLGPPVSGVLLDKYGGFHEVSWFAGAMTLFGALMTAAAKSQSKQGLFGTT